MEKVFLTIVQPAGTEIATVSGNELSMCKGITGGDYSYEYSNTTKEFIKGKKYPYGLW